MIVTKLSYCGTKCCMVPRIRPGEIVTNIFVRMFAEKLDMKQAILMKAKAALRHQKQSQAALHRQQDATNNDLKGMWAVSSILGRHCTASHSKDTQAAHGHNRCF